MAKPMEVLQALFHCRACGYFEPVEGSPKIVPRCCGRRMAKLLELLPATAQA